jgi:hypothetical protein
VVDPGGQLRAVQVRLGITDGAVTEVVAGDLRDQQDVVVGSGATSAQPPTGSPGAPRLRF